MVVGLRRDDWQGSELRELGADIQLIDKESCVCLPHAAMNHDSRKSGQRLSRPFASNAKLKSPESEARNSQYARQLTTPASISWHFGCDHDDAIANLIKSRPVGPRVSSHGEIQNRAKLGLSKRLFDSFQTGW